MKKVIISLIVSLFFVSGVFAETSKAKISEVYSGYKDVVVDESLDFEIERDDYKIEAQWDQYEWNDFKYYKLMKSYTNKNPVYPQDTAIFVGMESDQDEYEFQDWSNKSAYYRVCVITTDNGRICSKVVELEWYEHKKDFGDKDMDMCIQVIQPAYNPKTAECREFSTPCDVKKWWKKVSSCDSKEVVSLKEKLKDATDKQKLKYITRDLQKRADKVIDNIYDSVKNKDISDEEKIQYLEKIIEKLERVQEKSKSNKTLELVAYLIEKLEEKIELIEQKDDIESIFDILEE